jgi:hypothetical protein
MALEAANFIDELVSANPAAADSLGQADDHLRLIKAVLMASFPNISGAMTATDVELSGHEARIDDLEDVVTDMDGSVQDFYDGLYPLGRIILMGTDTDPNVGLPTGVTATWTALNANYMLVTVAAGAGDYNAASLASALDGAHDHGGVTGSHVLTIDEIPSHHHQWLGLTTGSSGSYGSGGNASSCGWHDTTSTGGGLGHTHTITAAATHNHAITGLPANYEVIAWQRTA